MNGEERRFPTLFYRGSIERVRKKARGRLDIIYTLEHTWARRKKKKSADRAIGPESCEPLKQPKPAGLAVHTASTRNVYSTPLITSPFRSTRPTLSLSLRHPGTHPRIFIYLRAGSAKTSSSSRFRDLDSRNPPHRSIIGRFNFPNPP